jgi:hypothetical protein
MRAAVSVLSCLAWLWEERRIASAPQRGFAGAFKPPAQEDAEGAMPSKLVLAVLAIGLASTLAPGAVAPARAEDPAYMSCGELWHARNRIYARNGYCFKTPRAIAVFGEGCFPPFGRLRGWEKDRVDEIQMWEARKGC